MARSRCRGRDQPRDGPGRASGYVVKDRLVNYASVVGKENVATGTDCGIGSRVGHEEIVWAKLATWQRAPNAPLAELWGR